MEKITTREAALIALSDGEKHSLASVHARRQFAQGKKITSREIGLTALALDHLVNAGLVYKTPPSTERSATYELLIPAWKTLEESLELMI